MAVDFLLLQVAAMLNGQPMGGKRRSSHFYDLWTLRYLPKFKWDNLTGKPGYFLAYQGLWCAGLAAVVAREIEETNSVPESCRRSYMIDAFNPHTLTHT